MIQSNTMTSEVFEILKAMQHINIQSKDRIQARLPYVINIK